MFKYRLKALRNAHHITQKELADAIGVVVSTVGKWEGKGDILPSDDIRQKLAEYFGVSIDYLMGYDSTTDLGNGLSENATEIGRIYDALNREGQLRVDEYVRMVAGNKDYRKESSSESAM